MLLAVLICACVEGEVVVLMRHVGNVYYVHCLGAVVTWGCMDVEG